MFTCMQTRDYCCTDLKPRMIVSISMMALIIALSETDNSPISPFGYTLVAATKKSRKERGGGDLLNPHPFFYASRMMTMRHCDF
jgi:hypothetical protein